MKDYTVFISSSDSYSDLWPMFFDMFQKYWPNFKGKIYLNTEFKIFEHESLNIICTNVGKYNSFGKTFRAGLDKVDSEVVILIMIDYLFMGKVKVEKLYEYLEFFKLNDLDSLCLVHQNYRQMEHSLNEELSFVIPPSRDMFSFQTAFWKKSMLYKMALPHENPWTSEWYGTQRANKMKIKLACPSDQAYNPIPYDPAGCLHKGKWLDNAITHLKSLNYDIDYNIRGYFAEPNRTIKSRLKIKWMLVRHGLIGSYWDIRKRKVNS
ncbi:MAG: hypothetical protein Q8R96_05830 [Bacteroidota bacterium]|nr:hypothetical protein [Bacteroidota bacterium]